MSRGRPLGFASYTALLTAQTTNTLFKISRFSKTPCIRTITAFVIRNYKDDNKFFRIVGSDSCILCPHRNYETTGNFELRQGILSDDVISPLVTTKKDSY